MGRLQGDLAVAVVHATFWTTLLFIPGVSAFWPWWRHQFGVALMSVNVLLVLAFLPAELGLLFGVADSWLTWFAIGVFALIPARTVWLALVIFRVQRAGKTMTTNGAWHPWHGKDSP